MREVTGLAFAEDGDMLKLILQFDDGDRQEVGLMKPESLYMLAKVVPTYATHHAIKHHPAGNKDVEPIAGIMEVEGFELQHSLLDQHVILGLRSGLGLTIQWKLRPDAAIAVGRELVDRGQKTAQIQSSISRN